jgi:hypothetical protein
MKKTSIFLIAMLMAPALAAQPTQNAEVSIRQATETAQAALPVLAGLAKQAPDALGLSEKEAGIARVEAPLRVLYVPLDALKNYSNGDPRALLKDGATLFFPVTVGGTVRSSISVQQRDGRWTATDFGRPALAKRIADNAGGAGAILIRVPALNLHFVGHETAGGLVLTALVDIPGTKLRAGESAAASEVFTAIVPLAKAANGLPT